MQRLVLWSQQVPKSFYNNQTLTYLQITVVSSELSKIIDWCKYWFCGANRHQKGWPCLGLKHWVDTSIGNFPNLYFMFVTIYPFTIPMFITPLTYPPISTLLLHICGVLLPFTTLMRVYLLFWWIQIHHLNPLYFLSMVKTLVCA